MMVAMRGFILAVALVVCLPLPGQAGSVQPLKTKTRYREILSSLAAGRTEEALSNLVQFEAATVGDTRAWRYLDNLWKLELHVIRDLLEGQTPDLLRPIVSLHHDAYFEYVGTQRRYLAGHARTMAAELAEVYAERKETREADLFSGWILTSFAAHLWSPSAVRESAALFYRAYLVDPGNEVAVLGLAAAHEKNGEYDKAIEYLTRALLMDPGDAEVRLRLALCQLRQDGAQPPFEVLSSLTALAGEGSPEWIRSIAFQEVARSQIEAEEVKRAEETLREGLEALPGDPQLSLLLAQLLDQGRSRDEALRLLSAIEVGGWQIESPRERYDVWAPVGVETARSSHLGETQEGLIALESGLSASPAETEGR